MPCLTLFTVQYKVQTVNNVAWITLWIFSVLDLIRVFSHSSKKKFPNQKLLVVPQLPERGSGLRLCGKSHPKLPFFTSPLKLVTVYAFKWNTLIQCSFEAHRSSLFFIGWRWENNKRCENMEIFLNIISLSSNSLKPCF